MTTKGILIQAITQRAHALQHSIISHTYIDIGLEMTKEECMNDIRKIYNKYLDELYSHCRLSDFNVDTTNKILNVLYHGVDRSNIIINTFLQ